MVNIPRREVDELVTGYDLHPLLFDVFVEGEFDRDFLVQFIGELGQQGAITVVPIETIDIPNAKLVELGLRPGSNKNRVLALAMLLEQKLGKRSSNLSCVIDADVDRLIDQIRTDFYVNYTDFTCMEMYALSSTTLAKFFTYTCSLTDAHIEQFLAIARVVLPIQFVARAVVEKLGLGVSIPDFLSGLGKKSHFESFDENKYVRIFLGACDPLRRAEADNLFKSLKKKLHKDIRNKAHGHDFICLLFAYLWKQGALKLQSKDYDVLRFGGRLLTTALRFETLVSEALFRSFKNALSGGTPMREPS